MPIQLSVENCKLQEGLKFVKTFLGKGKDDPIERCIHMYVTNDHKAILSCTDKNSWGECEVELLGSSGEGVLPNIDLNMLLNVITTLNPTQEIIIKYDENNNNSVEITYVGRKSSIVLNCVEGEFITAPTIQNSEKYDIMGITLKNGINKASEIITNSTSQEDAIKNCVCLTLAKGKALFEAIDTQTKSMMAYVLATNTNQQVRKFFECAKAKIMINSFDDECMSMYINENFISFQQGDKKAYLRLLNGNFFKITKLIPKQVDKVFKFNRLEFLSALNRINALISKTSVIKSCNVKFSNMFTTITSKNTRGVIVEDVICSSVSDEIEMSFMVNTLIKVLNVSVGDDIKISVLNNGIIVTSSDGKTYTQSIMVSKISGMN